MIWKITFERIQDATMAAILNIKTRPLECVPKNLISYSSIKTYVVDTQNNCLNETVFLSRQNICNLLKLLGYNKYLQFYANYFVNLNLCKQNSVINVAQLPLTKFQFN